tara:strand:- start:1572 stop:2216 length:645 start_codon:yes stop_codon:yes gene_type:complete
MLSLLFENIDADEVQLAADAAEDHEMLMSVYREHIVSLYRADFITLVEENGDTSVWYHPDREQGYAATSPELHHTHVAYAMGLVPERIYDTYDVSNIRDSALLPRIMRFMMRTGWVRVNVNRRGFDVSKGYDIGIECNDLKRVQYTLSHMMDLLDQKITRVYIDSNELPNSYSYLEDSSSITRFMKYGRISKSKMVAESDCTNGTANSHLDKRS